MRCVLLLLLISFNTIAQDISCVCCEANQTAFDFWIGEWTVTNPDGSYAGTNVIKRREADCRIIENWTSATEGLWGVSTSYYDPQKKKWIQLWIDSDDKGLYLVGNFIDGAMVLTSKPDYSPQGMKINRIIWTPYSDGTVRQQWESTLDEGKTWKTEFNGLYSPKK